MRWIHRPKDIEDKAAAIQAAGGRFEVEDASTTRVRIACIHEGKAVAYRPAKIIDRDITMAVDAVVEEAHGILIERDS